MNKIRVLIIDEHPAVCRALVARLSATPSIDVVGSAYTYEEGLDVLGTSRPDVILLELKISGEHEYDTLDVISGLLADGPAGVIVLTTYLDEIERQGALDAGARRYLLKEIDTGRLLGEIEAVARESHLFGEGSRIASESSPPSTGAL